MAVAVEVDVADISDVAASKQAPRRNKALEKKDSDRFADSDSDSDSCFRPVYLPPHSSPLRGPGQMIL